MFRHWNHWQLHPQPHWCPYTKKWTALPPTTLQNALGQKASPSLPDRWLRMSCLWTLLQLSRAQLPATLHHLPSIAAFSQGECWIQHMRLLSRHTAPAQPRRIHTAWRQPREGHLTPSALERPQEQPLHTGTTYLQQERTWYISSVYSRIYSSLWAFCIHKIVFLTLSPRASLQWGCFFQCLITVVVITQCHVAAQHCTAFSPKPSYAQGAVGRGNRLVQKIGISGYCLQTIQS